MCCPDSKCKNQKIQVLDQPDSVYQPSSKIVFIGDFIRILCDLSNKCFPPMSSTSGDLSLQKKYWNVSEKEMN